MKQQFVSPMSTSERVLGLGYIPIHVFFLPWLLNYAYSNVLRNMNVVLTGPSIDLIYYIVSFLFILFFLFHFMKASFFAFLDDFLKGLFSAAVGILFSFILMGLISLLLIVFNLEGANPNTAQVISQTRQNAGTIILIAVVLAPIVEETLFRGALFGTLLEKNRLLAYIISALLFAVYHLWQYVYTTGFDWKMLLYVLEYLPPALALCWCYERTGSVWPPVLLHAAMNLVSALILLG
ncbi:CPBP family intramembrane glutamic endopeptidase [Oscillospiraceae bacterium WX1]